MSDTRVVAQDRNTGRGSQVVWGVQIVLALLFLVAGGMKLAMPAAVLAHLTPLPVAFMKLIGVLEVAGALGLVLPGLFRVQRRLTPLAAVGLAGVMSGAVVVTLEAGQGAGVLVPLIVGGLAVFVARRRRSWIAAWAPGATQAPAAIPAVAEAPRVAA